jgi:hypothetical protein
MVQRIKPKTKKALGSCTKNNTKKKKGRHSYKKRYKEQKRETLIPRIKHKTKKQDNDAKEFFLKKRTKKQDNDSKDTK